MADFTPEQKLIFTARLCSYCGAVPELRSAREVFGDKAEGSGRFYVCPGCGARVGCHRFSEQAMGRVASAELRRLRGIAHKVFDTVWRDGHKRSRYNAYSWLALRLDIPRHLVHMGYFDEKECRRVIAVCARFLTARDARRYASFLPYCSYDAGPDVESAHEQDNEG
ncbi:MAG: DUF3268 family zinc-finger domain-containing protein [Muribaculaceae bacterium]|nr:DUF3268 family zinc-finger domain-containing protein [Muribaculaceae bacterium]